MIATGVWLYMTFQYSFMTYSNECIYAETWAVIEIYCSLFGDVNKKEVFVVCECTIVNIIS